VRSLQFPDDFLWGTATAAHQVEGGNVNNDWWDFEHDPSSPCVETSGDACDSWHRWPEDLDLVAGLGFGAYRFSLEWSRVEPEEGEWSHATLEHYRAMCAGCRERGLVPIVTFNHFTIPRWLVAHGGWEATDAPERFARYCERAAAAVGDLAGYACTLNEPNIVALMGYGYGIFPPGVRDGGRRRHVDAALCRAHRLGVDALRGVVGNLPVGLTLSMNDYQALAGGEQRLEEIRHQSEDVYLEATEGDDFVGVQTYSRVRVDASGMLGPEPGVALTQMGYEYWPRALGQTVRRAWAVTGIPVLVTENGIGTADDGVRRSFVTEALAALHGSIVDGVDVRGYLYWSLVDNFEWVLGYTPTFGLVAVDRGTFVRSPKPSAAWLGSLARTGRLEPGPA
jgi:beta-glucosidase